MMTPLYELVLFNFFIIDISSGQILLSFPERFVQCLERICDESVEPINNNLFEVAGILLETQDRYINNVRQLEIYSIDTIYHTHMIDYKGRRCWMAGAPAGAGAPGGGYGRR